MGPQTAIRQRALVWTEKKALQGQSNEGFSLFYFIFILWEVLEITV